jgi:hypothetical protein
VVTIGVPGNVHAESSQFRLAESPSAHAGYFNLPHSRTTNSKKGRTIMNNNYETAAVVELGQAGNSIRGMKVQDPFSYDEVLGSGWRTLETDIDESDE